MLRDLTCQCNLMVLILSGGKFEGPDELGFYNFLMEDTPFLRYTSVPTLGKTEKEQHDEAWKELFPDSLPPNVTDAS